MSTLAERSSSTHPRRRIGSKADLIVTMAMGGARPRAIAAEIGTGEDYVRQVICRARRDDDSIPYYRNPRGGMHNAARLLTQAVCTRLQEEAKYRGLVSGELIAELLTIIAEDGLFNAILERADDCD